MRPSFGPKLWSKLFDTKIKFELTPRPVTIKFHNFNPFYAKRSISINNASVLAFP